MRDKSGRDFACSDAEKQAHTLIINLSDSRCGNCGGGASPEQRIHDVDYPGYGGRGTKPGCGTEFRYVASDYIGLGGFYGRDITTEELYAEDYPDLGWNGFDERACEFCANGHRYEEDD